MAKKNRREALMEALADDTESSSPMTLDESSPVLNRVSSSLSGGTEPMQNFKYIPIDLLDPYSGKRDSDFSRYSPALHAQMVESIQQNGVIEPITVRKKDKGRFEILAGESRWRAAKDAGEKVMPSHIVDVDDAKAREIFSLTNLIRRDISYRDRINGWWHRYEALREQGKLQAFREKKYDVEVNDALSIEGAEQLEFRQIQRYVKCHDLIGEWVDRLDNGKVKFVDAHRVAFFPPEIQTILLAYQVDEKKLIELYKIYSGKIDGVSWDGEKTIEAVLGGKLKVVIPKKPVESGAKQFTRATKVKLYRTIQSQIRPEDFDHANEVVSKALKLYYEMSDKTSRS